MLKILGDFRELKLQIPKHPPKSLDGQIASCAAATCLLEHKQWKRQLENEGFTDTELKLLIPEAHLHLSKRWSKQIIAQWRDKWRHFLDQSPIEIMNRVMICKSGGTGDPPRQGRFQAIACLDQFGYTIHPGGIPLDPLIGGQFA